MSANSERLDVHDKVLREVIVQWEDARAELVFHSMRIVCTGLVSVRIPRENSWGPSVHGNSATVVEGTLNLEMQSGDTIEVRASTYRVEPPERR